MTDDNQALATTKAPDEREPYYHTKQLVRWGKGHPKYPHVWNADTKEAVLAEFAEGASLSEICTVIGIGRRTFYDWLGADGKEDFTETITRGTEIAKAWWIRQCRKNLLTREFNTRAFEFAMRNMYGWAGLGPTEQIPHGSKGAEVDESEGVRDTVDTNEIIRKARESAIDAEFSVVESQPAGTTNAAQGASQQAQEPQKAQKKTKRKKKMPPLPPKKKVTAQAAKAKATKKRKKTTAQAAKAKATKRTKRGARR